MSAAVTKLAYDLVDVFTSRPYAGNQLAVVHGADDLPDESLQAIAREFGFSETAFPMRPTHPDAAYRLRIFTPGTELGFAGLPSVGASWVLATSGQISRGTVLQECGVGLVQVQVDGTGSTLTGAAPHVGPELAALPLLDAVGLAPSDLDPSGITAGIAGCGMDFAYLPVTASALGRATLIPPGTVIEHSPRSVVVVAYDPEDRMARVRKFGLERSDEDAATGAAALGLGVYLTDRKVLPAYGLTDLAVVQGVEMGRPSLLDVRVRAVDGAAEMVSVRGGVTPIATGQIRVPPVIEESVNRHVPVRGSR
ncbi:PhzF family phenazine biosynthesis protein [Pseudonocardiaceae bacterium YIM PH 21723]|nr:PhzF family phenazine biosynthesis protein [Pseudonocardiaceae bacterium YIM PH 21723]